MKKFVVLLAALMLVVPVVSHAAAAAPVLTIVNGKASDGDGNAHGAPVLAADGVNIYSVTRANDQKSLKLVRSKDGGVTWGGMYNIATLTDSADFIYNASIAVSGDAVYPTQKIVHVVWHVCGQDSVGINNRIYYAWADAADLSTWSAPLLLNGSVVGPEDPNIAVTAKGKIFVKFQSQDEPPAMYLATSEAHDSGWFTEPAAIPVSASFRNPGDDSEIFVDKANNLHLSFPYCSDADCTMGGIKYSRLPAGSTTWTTPIDVLKPVANGHDHTGLTAFDANTIYIASIHNDSLTFFGSTNGGSTWTAKTIFAKTATLVTGSYVDITVNASKAITVGAPFNTLAADGSTLKGDGRIYRSTDGGASWSSPTTIKNVNFISMAVDGNGKSAIMTKGQSDDGEKVNYFSKEK